MKTRRLLSLLAGASLLAGTSLLTGCVPPPGYYGVHPYRYYSPVEPFLYYSLPYIWYLPDIYVGHPRGPAPGPRMMPAPPRGPRPGGPGIGPRPGGPGGPGPRR